MEVGVYHKIFPVLNYVHFLCLSSYKTVNMGFDLILASYTVNSNQSITGQITFRHRPVELPGTYGPMYDDAFLLHGRCACHGSDNKFFGALPE